MHRWTLHLLAGLAYAISLSACDRAPADSADAQSGPSAFACTSCVADDECTGGQRCVQVFDSAYCAQPCTGSCPIGQLCQKSSSAGGEPIDVCLPVDSPCGSVLEQQSLPVDSGSRAPEDVAPPEDASPAAAAIPPLDLQGTATLERFDFAVVGDTRPPFKGLTKLYPTAVITQIWKMVTSEQPPVAFAATTGDFGFSDANDAETATAQFDLYLQARAQFPGTVLPILGNHECTGATQSNCGPGSKHGMPPMYQIWLYKFVEPLGLPEPWYTVRLAAPDGSWTAKMVVIAANAWSDAQAKWLDETLATQTTYTVVLRHESWTVDEAPGVKPSNAIIEKYPYTVLIVGHAHTASWTPERRQLIVGNGGAPLSGQIDYGYALFRQRKDGALHFQVRHYVSRKAMLEAAVFADGSPAPLP